MPRMEFRCEKCGKLLRVDAVPGEKVTCSHCGALVTAPKAAPRPSRPAPQVMGGARPQPMAAPQPAAAAAPPMDEQLYEPPSSALAAMSVLMPWAISIVFHIGLLLVLMFFAFLRLEPAEEDELIIPSSKWSPDPGAPKVTKTKTNDAEKSKTALNKPAPDVRDKTRTDPNITIAVPTSSNTSAGASAFKNLFDKGGGAKFFGSKPGGNVTKIVYVVDKSGSMAMSFPYVKAELIRSVNELVPRQSFQVIFFADGKPTELTIGGRAQLHNATGRSKRETKTWVDKQIAQSISGKTDPRQALERAFKTRGGPPQLIYLLTDGMFPVETVDKLKRLNAGRKVHVNTIMFKDRMPDAERLLQKISRENGGVYKFISENQLGQDY